MGTTGCTAGRAVHSRTGDRQNPALSTVVSTGNPQVHARDCGRTSVTRCATAGYRVLRSTSSSTANAELSPGFVHSLWIRNSWYDFSEAGSDPARSAHDICLIWFVRSAIWLNSDRR